MLASLQADAKRFVLNDRHLAQVKNDPILSSDGAKDQSQTQPQTTNKGNSNSDAKHDDLKHDDDKNEIYGQYGHGSSSSDDSHRYFTDDTFKPHH